MSSRRSRQNRYLMGGNRWAALRLVALCLPLVVSSTSWDPSANACQMHLLHHGHVVVLGIPREDLVSFARPNP
ncbi:hypothetical protein F4810DRAFT_653981 [Camillea tinctor]|nr:hypothetical protein F4810DRAFT_653981 [Camillea tinctor]